MGRRPFFRRWARGTRPASKSTRAAFDRKLRIEAMEPRLLLSGEPGFSEWRSAIFDDGVSGTLDFRFERNAATIDELGDPVGPGAARYAAPTLATSDGVWTLAKENIGFAQSITGGAGWDHDGQTPLAVFIDRAVDKIFFVRGESFNIAATVSFRLPDGGEDLLQGAVAGRRYDPAQAIVHDGLVVFMTERLRQEAGEWIVEGVTFIYTQDLGQTFERVEQVGGGFDVPGLAGGVADGSERGQRWAFSNAFPETSHNDRLGAWFPWADYLHGQTDPEGGQIGLFRARRSAVGESWVVEPNVVVAEIWQPGTTNGTYHAHSAGMFTDGLVSFWGDTDNRNHMARHIASDLENYTTATWTHQTDFNGAWSPDADPVYRVGNQGASTAPGPEFGQVLVTGDEQPELIMMIEKPEVNGDPAVITNLQGSILARRVGPRYARRTSLWVHHLPGEGYVVWELLRDNVEPALHYSPDGVHWATITNHGNRTPFLYGNKIITWEDGDLFAVNVPEATDVVRPLSVHPGGTNLLAPTWESIVSPASGNTWRSVLYVGGEYVYADTLAPIDNQPSQPPPVIGGAPMWEITTDGVSSSLGKWEIAGIPSDGAAEHWLTTWHYALGSDGIDPGLQIGDSLPAATRWVANNQWVPAWRHAIPTPASTGDALQTATFSAAVEPVANRWLFAADAFVEGLSPIYPTAPGVSSPDEIAKIVDLGLTDEWTVGLWFGLPEISAFTMLDDAAGERALHPIATLVQTSGTSGTYIQVGIESTSADNFSLVVDVYQGGSLVDRLGFPSFYLDVLDTARVIISSSPDAFGATVLSPRSAYGVRSKSILGGAPINPNRVQFSNVGETVVTPTEWYAVHVNANAALSTAERESMIVSADMLAVLDLEIFDSQLLGNFDGDGDVDGDDFLIWQANFGTTSGAERADGDADRDGDVDGDDFLIWQSSFGTIFTPYAADFDSDFDVDGDDFLVWQGGLGTASGATRSDGDADCDGDVDGDDFLVWQSLFGSGFVLPSNGAGGAAGAEASHSNATNDSPKRLQVTGDLTDHVRATLRGANQAATRRALQARDAALSGTYDFATTSTRLARTQNATTAIASEVAAIRIADKRRDEGPVGVRLAGGESDSRNGTRDATKRRRADSKREGVDHGAPLNGRTPVEVIDAKLRPAKARRASRE